MRLFGGRHTHGSWLSANRHSFTGLLQPFTAQKFECISSYGKTFLRSNNMSVRVHQLMVVLFSCSIKNDIFGKVGLIKAYLHQ